ncbi:MAG: shikimate dehydrogenase [Magnetococcales bacterium]|nr:shikimate dehydrogenase [Magnetococcales bacterium]
MALRFNSSTFRIPFEGVFMFIDGKTRLLGVIGDPVHHSLSPAMHNLACAELGLNYCYLPMHVVPENLRKAVEGMRAIGMVGFNATIPHKEALVSMMDELDPVAAMIGAVNTVAISSEGRLWGYNTDVYGFVTALREAHVVSLQDASVVVLGAGGAARGVVAGLLELGVGRIVLVNRTESRAVALAAASGSGLVEAVSWSVLSEVLEGCRLLVNTTSLGLSGVESGVLDLSPLSDGAFVYDIVYSPPETPLMAAARARGLRAENGLGMLIHQGARAFEIWTGRQMPVARVEVLLRGLVGGSGSGSRSSSSR